MFHFGRQVLLVNYKQTYSHFQEFVYVLCKVLTRNSFKFCLHLFAIYCKSNTFKITLHQSIEWEATRRKKL